MKLKNIIVITTVVSLGILIVKPKVIPIINAIHQSESTDLISNNNSFIQTQPKIHQISGYHLKNSIYDSQIEEFCKINKISTSERWTNLLGRLIILGSFTSFGVMSNSVVIERYVKLIFKDILPIFIVIVFFISLLAIVSIVTTIYFSSAPSTNYSLTYQNGCNLK